MRYIVGSVLVIALICSILFEQYYYAKTETEFNLENFDCWIYYCGSFMEFKEYTNGNFLFMNNFRRQRHDNDFGISWK